MTSPTDPPCGNQRLGDFEIIREIGRGGMGVVYEARQLSLSRKVALKVLSGGLGLSPNAARRFRREAEAAAKLHHTNIVPVFVSGEENGTLYYAMELIDGPSLDNVIRRLRTGPATGVGLVSESPGARQADSTPDPDRTGPYVESAAVGAAAALSASSLSSDGQYFDTAARMIADVAEALEYAHQQGVIHRDIKPSNLLLSPPERLSVNDFGLARMLEQPGMTMTGEFVGTPAYMSPEQITAGRTPLDHRTDIYSLGATLYELLTWVPPFTGKQREQLLAQILHKEPRRPRKLNRKVPVDLETICLKALEKDPDRRYQTAGQMADDLRRYVNRFVIWARRAGPVGRLVKWVRRRPAVSALLACVAVTLGVAVALAYRTYHTEQQWRAEKRQIVIDRATLAAMGAQFEEAEEGIREAERLGAMPGQLHQLRGQVALHAGKGDEAIAHLEQAVALAPNSIAARSMLASAYGAAVHWSKAYPILRELEQLVPVSAEDHLYKGYAIAQIAPQSALKSLEEAVRMRPSPVARLVRAMVRSHIAEDTGELADAERAVQDAERSKDDLPGNPFVLRTSVMAHMAAATAYEATNQPGRRAAALARARADAEALKASRLRRAVFTRWQFFAYVGEDGAMADEIRSDAQDTGDTVILGWYGQELYRQGKPLEVIALLKETRRSFVPDVIRAFALAEGPDGKAQALRAWQEMSGSLNGWHWLYGRSVLPFVGADAEAAAALREFRAQPERFTAPHSFVFERALAYCAGEIGSDVFLDGLAGSRLATGRAHYLIAIAKLGKGDRIGARHHLEQCVATRAFTLWTWDMSRLLLARLEKDRDWPSWIRGRE